MKYSLSFTAASLAANETQIISKIYLEEREWDIVKRKVVDDNILQKGTIATRKREFAEIKKRISNLNEEELKFFVSSIGDELKHIALLSVYKTYRFIFDFAVEVIRRKYLLFDYEILDSDYEKFFESKKLAYEKLNTISQKTCYKIKQVSFKIFEQAGILDSVKTKNIKKPYLSNNLIEIIVKDDPKYLKGFLYSDQDIDEAIKRIK